MTKKRPNFNIIERSSADLQKEKEALFEEIKPLLDKGYSLYNAVKEVKGTTVTAKNAWYKSLEKYCEKQGYDCKGRK